MVCVLGGGGLIVSASVMGFMGGQVVAWHLGLALAGGLVLVAGFVLLARLLVSLRKTYRAARVAEGNTASFLASMSHELRTPMTGVIGLSELLIRSELNPKQQELASGLKAAGESMISVINDVLDMSKIEAGMLEVESIDFDPLELLESVERLFTPLAEKKGLELSVECHEGADVTFRGDPARIYQVLNNLMSNAIKFTRDGGIRLTCRLNVGANGQILQFSVTDTGLGMDEKTLLRVFEPYKQAESSTAREYGGTGLGLSISRRLANLLGGDLLATSEPGVGSTFHLSIPASHAEPVVDKPVDRNEAEAACRAIVPEGLRIMVVDDVTTNRMVIKAMLERYQASVMLFADAFALADAYENEPCDLVLTDIQMPGMDGFELTSRIREYEDRTQQAPVPIFAITANVIGQDTQRYYDAGMNGFINKPLVLADLESALVSAAPMKQSGEVELF